MDAVRIVYRGPFDQVEVQHDGQWLTFTRDVPVDVPAALAHGGAETVLDSGERITSALGGLLEQADNWQMAKARRAAAAGNED